MLLLAAGRPFDVMVTKPNVDCSIDAASGEMHITQVLQVCMAPQCLICVLRKYTRLHTFLTSPLYDKVVPIAHRTCSRTV